MAMREEGTRIGQKRVGRLMRAAGIAGVSRSRSTVGGRHRLGQDMEGVSVRGGSAGRLQPPGGPLGDGRPPAHRIGPGRANMALWQRRRAHGVIHHSDQGASPPTGRRANDSQRPGSRAGRQASAARRSV